MIIVADIGGSHMRIAASDTLNSFEEPLVYDTPAEFAVAVSTFANIARDAARNRPITGCIIGIAGLLSTDRTTLLRSPHLRGWEGKNLIDEFGRAISAPVRFENDAALGALGEARGGAGVDASIIAYVTIGTGIGGARIVDGYIDRATFGFEIGHQRLGIDASAPEWETLISGSGLAQKYGRSSSEITDPAIWNTCADYFAYGLYNTILHWSPERVVLGGNAFQSGDIPLERVRGTLRSIASALYEIPDIRLATLGDHSGLYGALALIPA